MNEMASRYPRQPPTKTMRTKCYGLPNALDRKYPSAAAEWRWQWVFPQENRWRNADTRKEGRHHIDESLVQRAVKDAVRPQ